MVICLLIPSAALAAAGLWLRKAWSPVGPGEARVVEIPIASDTLDIGVRLEHEGLIRSQPAFQVGILFWGLRGELKAGYYELSPAMGSREIAEVIASGRQATAKVTIPEGFTVEQIAERFDATGLCPSGEDFLAAAVPATVADTGLDVSGNSLEGYLFPATYVFEYGTAPKDIVRRMAEEFHKRVVVGMADDLRESKHTLGATATVASMIEREARVEKDRPLIASVIYNRLNKGMRLQIDATVIYALGEHRERLTYEDLKVDSPFNTYRHTGLPPHPICNPGEASLRAAVKPAKTEYLFYVAKPDGSHVFTKTYDQHKRAIRAIRGGGD